jgi:histidine ammonia-lyase
MALSRLGTRLRLDKSVAAKVRASRRVVENALAEGRSVYGVNTGFGKLSNVLIPAAKLATLQKNLLLSHACGVGEDLPVDVSRLAFALRLNAICLGCSGVRVELLHLMRELYNADLVPVIPSQGSVGASGDLAPLAHMALPLIGRGEVHDGRKKISGKAALRRIGAEPIELSAKEGLALINGTQIMTALGLIVLERSLQLSRASDIACAMTLEALRGTDRPYVAAIHEARPHRGQKWTAANLRSLLKGSKILPSHADCGRVQDAYSLRCSPQVHGAAKESFEFARTVLEVEANSVTDNPLVFADGEVLSAGNFHGQPVSQALDFLTISAATLANISERRTENLVNPDISGLPAFLAADPGLESGMMIPQVVAAALVSENKSLAHPASVDTVPTSANREDHVSMGVTAARHAQRVVENSTRVLGIELLAAAAGLDCGESLAPGRGVAAAYAAVREQVAPLKRDRVLAPDLEKAAELVGSGSLARAVEKKIGALEPRS